MKKIIVIALICLFGFTSRLFVFQSQHPDTDELFELRNMQRLTPTDVLKRTTFYGDHTSFPGEYLIHLAPMAALNMFNKPADLSYEDGTIGVKKHEFWILSMPKIIISLTAFYLFWLMCGNFLSTTLGFIVAFLMISLNATLIYHSFSLRPYGILPELAIINLYLSSRKNNEKNFSLFHGTIILFTCIYHAYGILIAFLPLIFFKPQRHENIILVNVAAVIMWVYYASYNTFGVTPNHVQSVVDPFQFITKENFLNGIIDALFSGSLLTVASLTLVMIGAARADHSEILFLLILVLLPLTLIILVDIKTSYWIHPRQFCWIIPALAIWCGKMADKCSIPDPTRTK